MSSAYRLPHCLLIILHLHLLDYPLQKQNAAGYDERLFDPSRGMRERSKAMEDITYFLVSKTEGSRERAKVILPTYPCLHPSDSSAYRMALAKYLEGIRNAIVYTTHANQAKGKQPATFPEQEIAPWWWKDVVVRKSILDECCGDRFERLILSLSTHAIFKNTNRTGISSATEDRELEHDIGTLSRAYTIALAAAQNTRLGWERLAAILVQRQFDLATIRARIADPDVPAISRYGSLTTDRLLALQDSRKQDLLRGAWKGEESHSALELITDLASLIDSSASASLGTDFLRQIDEKETESRAHTHTSQSEVAAGTISPLPIAAARHPAHLHSLGSPLFPTLKPSQSSGNVHAEDSGTLTSPAITERLAAIEKVQSSLQNALQSAQNMRSRLQLQLQKAENRVAPKPSTQKVKGGQVHLDRRIWERRIGKSVDFKKLPDATILAKFDLAVPPSENGIEERIAHIRTVLLPPFTADPTHPAPESEPAFESENAVGAPQPASRLRPPSSQLHTTTTRAHVPKTSLPKPSKAVIAAKLKPSGPSRRVRVVDGTKGSRVPSVTSQRVQDDHGQKSKVASASGAKGRRMSRRASAARTRRSTMFGRGEDAEIRRIVESVQDGSDAEEDDAYGLHPSSISAHTARTPFTRTPARQVTRGALLSTVKKTAPRLSFDIEKYERVHVPRLPSLHLEDASELDEDRNPNKHAGTITAEVKPEDEDASTDVVYEGNSMTLADILLTAAGHTSIALLDEDELDYASD